MLMFRVTNFDKLLDKATSNLRLDTDWPSIMQICDLIRQNDTTPKYAMNAIKKKLYSQNPHQAMFALLVLESIVKNCGTSVHDELSTKENCEMFCDLIKTTQHENLKSKMLELIQAWAFAFRNTPKYRAVQDTMNILKAEGYKFPALRESDAMFLSDTAPEWSDGEVCHRCRVQFNFMLRKHHCRACGQVFCQQCSSKTSTIPKFGIEKDVRVCDACYDLVSRPPSSKQDHESDQGTSQKPPGKSAEELQEEEDLQLALAISQSEAEQREKEKRSFKAPMTNATSVVQQPQAPSSPIESSGNNELARYLDRAYWEQKNPTALTNTNSAPAANNPVANLAKQMTNVTSLASAITAVEKGSATDTELEEFVSTLKSQIEIFVNRMKSNSSRGRSIANDTSVQTLFMNITTMHSKLLRYIQKQDDNRVYYESLQDKVSAARDSRAALDTLREEHYERQARAAEAAERQRQMQMAAKLEAMRQKKHEYLQYQRQLALRRVHDTELQMHARQEQQKQQYMQQYYNMYPGQFMVPGAGNRPQFQTGPQSMQTATSQAMPPFMQGNNMMMSQHMMPSGPQSMPHLNMQPMQRMQMPGQQSFNPANMQQRQVNQPNSLPSTPQHMQNNQMTQGIPQQMGMQGPVPGMMQNHNMQMNQVSHVRLPQNIPQMMPGMQQMQPNIQHMPQVMGQLQPGQTPQGIMVQQQLSKGIVGQGMMGPSQHTMGHMQQQAMGPIQHTQGLPQQPQGMQQQAQNIAQPPQGHPPHSSQQPQGIQQPQGMHPQPQAIPPLSQGAPQPTQGIPQQQQNMSQTPQNLQGHAQQPQGMPQIPQGIPQQPGLPPQAPPAQQFTNNIQSPQNQVKTEESTNTAELISFD